MTKWTTFYWDSNTIWGVVDSLDTWKKILATYDKESFKLDLGKAKIAVWNHPSKLIEAGKEMPSFGFRREHKGTITLREWSKEHNMELEFNYEHLQNI